MKIKKTIDWILESKSFISLESKPSVLDEIQSAKRCFDGKNYLMPIHFAYAPVLSRVAAKEVYMQSEKESDLFKLINGSSTKDIRLKKNRCKEQEKDIRTIGSIFHSEDHGYFILSYIGDGKISLISLDTGKPFSPAVLIKDHEVDEDGNLKLKKENVRELVHGNTFALFAQNLEAYIKNRVLDTYGE